MSDKEKSAGIVLGPGAYNNTFINAKVSGFSTGVVDQGHGNKFVGLSIKDAEIGVLANGRNLTVEGLLVSASIRQMASAIDPEAFKELARKKFPDSEGADLAVAVLDDLKVGKDATAILDRIEANPAYRRCDGDRHRQDNLGYDLCPVLRVSPSYPHRSTEYHEPAADLE